jgi:DNA-directed RNA polymerase alpha subunit
METELLVKKNQELQEENERLKLALKTLQQELDECRKALDIKKEVQARLKNAKAKYSTEEVIAMTELFNKEIKELPLKVRTMNILRMSDISTLGDLLKIGKMGLLKLRNCGPKTRNDIEEFMKNNGLSWDIDVNEIIELSAKKAVSKK